MKWFMLEFPDLGKDRCNIVRNLSEWFLGISPIGGNLEILKRGSEKGPQYALNHFLS